MSKKKYLGIVIDESRTEKMSEAAQDLIKGFYCKNGETIQEALARPAVAWADDLDHAQRLYDASSLSHFMWSSPSFANAPLPGEAPIGQNISCFLPYVGDTVPDLLLSKLELSILSVLGGGLGQFYDVRYPSAKSPGPIPFIHEADGSILAWKQGRTRRGALAAWLSAKHGSSLEFMNIRTPTGDMNRKAENIHIGFSIEDEMMEAIRDGKQEYDLIDPKTGETVNTVNPLNHFTNMVRVRSRTGEPFMWFVDTANEFLPEPQKRLGLKSHASNLCFAGETRVIVADGRKPQTIKQLSKESNGTLKFDVWSARWIDGKSRPEIRKATSKQTGTREVVVVVFKNGETFRCTRDHKLFQTNGKMIEAKDSVGKTLDSYQFKHGDMISNPVDMRVVEIKYTGEVEPVYCLTVEGNHNFYISTGTTGNDWSHNAVLVKNCTEISLAANEERTPVCMLSSLNAEYYEDWSPTLVRDLVRALDNGLTHFINTVMDIQYRYPEHNRELLRLALKKVKYSAERERSIGVGLMGFHYALQKRGFEYGDEDSKKFNDELFTYIKEEAVKESLLLGKERGVAPDAEGDDHTHVGRRNLHLLAIAPNSNSADMLDTSASIDPEYSNIYTKETRVGIFERRNPYLVKLLQEKGIDTDEVWDQIVADEGSVKNIKELSDKEKRVFYTAFEIDQFNIVRLAADRQPKICQAQSLNLYIRPGTDINTVVGLHYKAWEWKLKSLYYYRTTPEVKIERLSEEVKRERLKDAVNPAVVYGTTICPNCKIAKRLLEEMDIRYDYVALDEVGKTAAEVTGDPACRTVPQIFIDGKWIGGLKELQILHRDYHNSIIAGMEAATSSSDECINCQG